MSNLSRTIAKLRNRSLPYQNKVTTQNLKTEKVGINIKLQKFTENDFALYFELVNDEKVMEMITERALGIEEAKSDFDKIIENNKLNKNFGNFKILDENSNEYIGFAKLEVKTKEDKEAELGYMVLPKYWRQGIAGKVVKQLIQSAKELKDIESIYAIIDPKNIASRKILINNGFETIAFRDFDGLPGEILGLRL